MKPEQTTAWALDEASVEERQQLEAALLENPQDKQKAEETKAFCDFLLSELRDDSLALTETQRDKLKAQPVAPVSRVPAVSRMPASQTKWRIGIIVRLAVAACAVLGGFWTWQSYSLKHNTPQVSVADKPGIKVNLPLAIDSKKKPGQPKEKPKKTPMTIAMVPPVGKPLSPAPMPASVSTPSALDLNKEHKQMSPGDLEELKRIQDHAAYALNFDVKAAASLAKVSAMQKPKQEMAATRPDSLMLPAAAGLIEAGKGMPPATPTVALISNPEPDTRYFTAETPLSRSAGKDPGLKDFSERGVIEKSGESYTRIIENELKDVAREPLSTLSIDVDTASYANVRRFLNQNMTPPQDAVRIEELVNYFPTAEEGPAHEAKEPFAVRVELAPCPWQPVHRLARIAIKGREMDKDRKASNLVFLVDVSGSMNEPAKLPLVQQSLRMLTEQLGEGDRVTMVVYAGSSGVVLPPTNGEKKAEILAAIDRLSAGGSTHGSAGIKLAYEQAVDGFIKGGVNRVILCTDGDFNVGVSSPEELEKLIKHKARTGVFLSVLGFGSGNLQDRTMETLADKGNGNYAYIDSLSEARKVLVEQMSETLDTIAKDVKIQVEFNPAAVRSYRLIGYENRLLAKEDFNDDTKDAGEVGAGHSVVALYEIVPADLPPGAEPRPAVDNLKYQAPAISHEQLAEAAKSGETMTVKLRYKEPDSDLSKLIEVPAKDAGQTLTASSDEFKFSAAVAGFGLLLRDSAYEGTLSWETVRRLALDGKGSDKLGYRGEFLQLIDKARRLEETRP
jgi:secreted protein with Ig-like and vWFA domain